MGKRESGAERRERLEAVRKEQQAAARKRTLITAGIGLGAGVLIIGGTSFGIYASQKNDPERQPFTSYGVPAAEAGCTDVEKHTAEGVNNHVTERVEYDTVPPAYGPHHPQWVGYPRSPSQRFYTVEDAPDVENVVHNLEHGYNIVWYSPDLPADQVEDLRNLTAKIHSDPKTHKFMAVPWDEERGELPDGMQIGISHWGVPDGSVQHCEQLSGEAIAQFVDDHPITNAPEPNAY